MCVLFYLKVVSCYLSSCVEESWRILKQSTRENAIDEKEWQSKLVCVRGLQYNKNFAISLEKFSSNIIVLEIDNKCVQESNNTYFVQAKVG